jgi:hypothetical protein
MAAQFLLLAARADGNPNAPESELELLLATRAPVPSRVARHAGPQASHRTPVPGKVGAAHWDQAAELAGHQLAGVPVNAWTRTPVTYPGFTGPSEEILLFYSVLADDSQYC